MELLKEKEILEGVHINFNKELGRGSYAAVYEAEWSGLSCVAKVFHKDIFPDWPTNTWKQLAREIELLQCMHHPNIVQLLGFIPETKSSSIPSIVMERLDTNLTSLIEEHHSLLSFDIQVCILHDVAVGLNFLHSHKEPIVHRDLSSNNILLTDHLVAKISDLGLAKHIKSAKEQVGSSSGFGTQDYMPPEVLGQKPPQISPKTDVFSFGVVMLQVATGKRPDVRGILNVDTEVHRRKHHLGMLNKSNLFCPLVLKCLNKSSHRPAAAALCETFKRFGVTRKSTLMYIKTFQDERLDLTKQLEALESQLKNHKENMRKLQHDKVALETKLGEEKKAAVLNGKQYETELNDVLNFTNQLQKDICVEKETQKVLHTKITKHKNAAKVFQEEKIELTKQLEALQLQRENDMQNMQEQLVEKETQKVLRTEITKHKNAAKVFQEEKFELTKQLEALQLQRENDMQNMQEQLQELQKKLSIAKDSQNALHVENVQHKTTIKVFQEEKVKLTKQLKTLQLQTERDVQKSMQEEINQSHYSNSKATGVTLKPNMIHHNSTVKQNERSLVADESYKPPYQCSSPGVIQQGNT